MGKRICHANADNNGIRTESNMSPLTFGGGGKGGGGINISEGFDVTERTRVCGRNGNF